MPVIRKGTVPGKTGTSYPGALGEGMGRGTWHVLSEAEGLTQFGAALETLPPGTVSSHRHWHEQEDEFLYLLEGTLTLIEEDGPHEMHPGDAAAWKAGTPNGHQLKNLSDAPAVYLIVGTRADSDVCHYTDVDLLYRRENGVSRFTHRDGTVFKTSDKGDHK